MLFAFQLIESGSEITQREDPVDHRSYAIGLDRATISIWSQRLPTVRLSFAGLFTTAVERDRLWLPKQTSTTSMREAVALVQVSLALSVALKLQAVSV